MRAGVADFESDPGRSAITLPVLSMRTFRPVDSRSFFDEFGPLAFVEFRSRNLGELDLLLSDPVGVFADPVESASTVRRNGKLFDRVVGGTRGKCDHQKKDTGDESEFHVFRARILAARALRSNTATYSRGLRRVNSTNFLNLLAAGGGGTEQSEDLLFGEDALGLLGGIENTIDQFVGGRNAAFFEPEDHV